MTRADMERAIRGMLSDAIAEVADARADEEASDYGDSSASMERRHAEGYADALRDVLADVFGVIV